MKSASSVKKGKGASVYVEKRRGWQLLRDRLKDGTLMPALRRFSNAGNIKKLSRRSSIRASMSALTNIGIPKHATVFRKLNAKMILMEAKMAHEQTKKKQRERQIRRKLIQKQQKLERELEYLNFPTIFGWYFDGFFTPYFQLNEEYAAIFNQMEVEIAKAKENSLKETFVERAKRYFWPPKVIGGLFFRTRGIYLDFKEIMKDPPHTPPEIALDQRQEAVTLFVGADNDNASKVASDEYIGMDVMGTITSEIAAEEERTQETIKEIENDQGLTPEEKSIKIKAMLFALKKKKQRIRMKNTGQGMDDPWFKAINKNNFYFDDQIPGFFFKTKKDKDKYYFDTEWEIWRVKRQIIPFANDYYWDEQMAMFFPKDRTRGRDYYMFDHVLKAYRVAGSGAAQNWRGIKPTAYFFDYKQGKYFKISKAPASLPPYMDKNGNRLCINKSKDTPDDYFFSVTSEQFELKDPAHNYFYDSDFGAWRLTNTPLPERNRGALKPLNYYWSEVESKFKKKDAPASFFAWDQNNNFFRKKKSMHGKYHPKNWTWVEAQKEWQVKGGLLRHTMTSDSLYWRPDRDYDKPWLEYTGGFKGYRIDNSYNQNSDEDDKASHLTGKSGKTNVSGAGLATLTEVDPKEKKLQFSSSAPGLKGKPESPHIVGFKQTFKQLKPGAEPSSRPGAEPSSRSGTGPSSRPGTAPKVEPGAKPGIDDPSSKAVGIMKTDVKEDAPPYIDTLDRRTLKITNLGSVLTDIDIRKYFSNLKKVIRPKIPDTELDAEYAYLRFKTDEAASAALKTMQGQVIKGQTIKLEYKLKAEDETGETQLDPK